ncbi:MAG: DUF2267 domain-containing protein [Candidatus Thorarchaeota archaeon]
MSSLTIEKKMSTSISSLDRSIQLSMEWLKEIGEELGWPDEERVYSATKAVLNALRDRLPIGEAVEFAAQLPMLLKGIYYDSYDTGGKPLKIREREEFYELVRDNFGRDPLNPRDPIIAVLKVYREKTGTGEFEDIKNVMPEELRGFFVAAEKD